MLRLGCIVLALLASVVPPRSVRVRIVIDAPRELSAEAGRVSRSLERGLYLDSLIVPVADSAWAAYSASARDTATLRSRFADSAAAANAPSLNVIRGLVVQPGSSLEVRLQVFNLLMVSVAGPDTLRVARADLESAVVEQGRLYARRLARRR